MERGKWTSLAMAGCVASDLEPVSLGSHERLYVMTSQTRGKRGIMVVAPIPSESAAPALADITAMLMDSCGLLVPHI